MFYTINLLGDFMKVNIHDAYYASLAGCVSMHIIKDLAYEGVFPLPSAGCRYADGSKTTIVCGGIHPNIEMLLDGLELSFLVAFATTILHKEGHSVFATFLDALKLVCILSVFSTLVLKIQ